MRSFTFGILLVSTLFVSLAKADDFGSWDQVRRDYDAGRYSQALTTLLESPQPSAPFYYNLGNIYFRLEKYGLALAYFEKAWHLAPFDSEVRHNFKLSLERMKAFTGRSFTDFSASGPIERFDETLPLPELAGALGLLSFFFLIYLTLSYRKNRNLIHVLTLPSGLAASLSLTGVILFSTLHWIAQMDPALVLMHDAIIRSGPGPHFLELSEGFSGMKVRAIKKTTVTHSVNSTSSEKNEGETWYQVRYGPKEIGWIQESALLGGI